MNKIKLPVIPNDVPDALRTLADFLQAHPEIRIEQVELTSFDSDVFQSMTKRFVSDVRSHSVSRWAVMEPTGGNDDRQLKVEVIAFDRPES